MQMAYCLIQFNPFAPEPPMRIQARNQGGCMGCVRTPPQAPKVHILILNIQVKECGRLNWSFKLNSDI